MCAVQFVKPKITNQSAEKSHLVLMSLHHARAQLMPKTGRLNAHQANLPKIAAKHVKHMKVRVAVLTPIVLAQLGLKTPNQKALLAKTGTLVILKH